MHGVGYPPTGIKFTFYINVKMIKPNPWLVGTSFCFILPATLNAVKGKWALYSIDVAMMIVSSVYHMTKIVPIFYVDAFTGYLLAIMHVIYAIYMEVAWIPMSGIIYCMILFYYGYIFKQFVWHPILLYAIPNLSCKAAQIRDGMYRCIYLCYL